MSYTVVYDVANDSVGLQFPFMGLALILIGAGMKWIFGKSGLACYPIIAVGVFVILTAGALPWWDHNRVMQALVKGDAQQIEGPIHDWRILRGRRLGYRNYLHYERFSVGNVDFRIEWNALEAGFANRGSTEERPTVRLSNGRPALIWYLPIDGPDKPPRIVRIELASGGGEPAPHNAGMAQSGLAVPPQSRVTDDAGVLSTAQKAQIETSIAVFEQMTGHQLAVVTITSLGGKEIARYAADLANDRGQDDGILLLVAPSERQARITVGRGLEARLPDAASKEIMELSITPLFRRGDIAGGIEAGVAMIVGKVMSEEMR